MSDNKTQPTPPPSPVAKTSAVPLKKETVRITLRARPGAGVTQPKELTTPVPSVGTSPIPSVSGAVPAPRTATAPVTPAPVSKSTSPIQLPSAPLPPPAVRPSTAPVQVPPPSVPAPSVNRATSQVRLDQSPAAPLPPPAPSIPRPVAPAGGPPSALGRPPIAPTVPMAKAPSGPPSAPGAPRAPLPAATVPLGKAPSPPRPPGAPPAPGGVKVEAGASTVPLAKSGIPKPPPGTGTSPMAKGGPGAPAIGAGATAQLPKATVKLGQTAPMNRGSATAPAISTAPRPAADFDEEVEQDPETGLVPLAVLSLVVAAVLALVNLFNNDKFQVYASPTDVTHYVFPAAPDEQPWEAPGHTFAETLKAQTRDIQ